MISRNTITKALRFARAILKYAADSCRNVTAQELELRLGVCRACENYQNDRCNACGCNLALKARMKSSVCPLEKWPV